MEQPIFDTAVEYIITQGLEGGVVLQGPGGYLAQLFVSTKHLWQEHPALTLFARLAGLHPEEGENLPVQAWTFLGQVLVMMRRLLGLKWRLLRKEWAKGRAFVSEQSVRDLVGNLYNTDVIDALPAWSQAFSPALDSHPEQSGRVMMLEDVFVACIERWRLGECPRNPTFFPRRVGGAQTPSAGAARGQEGDIPVAKGDPFNMVGIRGGEVLSRASPQGGSRARPGAAGPPARGPPPEDDDEEGIDVRGMTRTATGSLRNVNTSGSDVGQR